MSHVPVFGALFGAQVLSRMGHALALAAWTQVSSEP